MEVSAQASGFDQSSQDNGDLAFHLVMREQILRTPIHPYLTIKKRYSALLRELFGTNPAAEGIQGGDTIGNADRVFNDDRAHGLALYRLGRSMPKACLRL